MGGGGGGGGGKLLTLLSAPIPHLLLRRRRPPQLRRLFTTPAASAGGGIPSLRRLTPTAPITLRRPPAASAKRDLLHTHAARFTASAAVSDDQHPAHPWPWPEWSSFLQLLSSRGYFDRVGGEGGDFAPSAQGLPNQFVREATACLLFAADRPELLRSLSRENIEVVVENGAASLFVNSVDTANRMRSYLANNDVNVLESESGRTLDLMRYLLTYSANHLLASHEGKFSNQDIVELSVRNIINELIGLFRSSEGFSFSESFSMQPRGAPLQSPGSYSQPIQMKRGDWLCPKCNFMNFARNEVCLECKVDRPARTLTGREWDCPQCNFLNYGRNTVCLRCDCRQPGESLSAPSAFSGPEFIKRSDTTQPPTGNNSNQIEIERRLAANDEKAERWFSKMSQMDGVSDMSIDDEDFPEIMPLRKGVNRFVVSTRKTPLERRLANAQYRKNLGNGGSPEADGPNTPSSSITDNLDRILGRVTKASEKDNLSLQNVNASSTSENMKNETDVSRFDQHVKNQRSDDDYVPFVPFPPNMFAQNQSEVNDVSDRSSTVADDDFPDVMPMRQGENRFVVGKKKSGSVRLPKYNRRLALEQANSSSPAPFVPFPSDYFAKKDPQSEAGEPTSKAESSNISHSILPIQTSTPQSTDDKETPGPNLRISNSKSVINENLETTKPYQESSYVPKKESGTGENVGLGSSLTNTQYSNDQPIPQPSGNNPQYGKISSENRGFTGKSLEGSAVTEPDPLDMSEEAKAARWFRRVQNITDISELANIPDEDFPSIMPMRKGVNRFVVSKRKTPLERRLTSPKYRRDLPIYNSEPKPMSPPDNEVSN